MRLKDLIENMIGDELVTFLENVGQILMVMIVVITSVAMAMSVTMIVAV